MKIKNTPEDSFAKKLWCGQERNWTCGVASLRMVLRYYGIEQSEDHLLKQLRILKLKKFDFGIYSIYIGILALRLGFNVLIRIPLKKLSDMENQYNKEKKLVEIIDEVLNKISKKEPSYYLYKSIKILLKHGGRIKIYVKGPTINHIQKAIQRDIPVIVRVPSAVYYDIKNDPSFHHLVLLPMGEGFMVLDCYELIGYNDCENWIYHLETSKKYDWNTWSETMIEICKRNSRMHNIFR